MVDLVGCRTDSVQYKRLESEETQQILGVSSRCIVIHTQIDTRTHTYTTLCTTVHTQFPDALH